MTTRSQRGAVWMGVMTFLAANILAAQAWRGAADLEVRVSSRRGGNISGARVELMYRDGRGDQGPPPVATDGRGRAVIQGLAAGTWQVEVQHPDYMSFVAVVRLDPREKPKITASFLEATAESSAPIQVKLLKSKGGPASPPLRVVASPPAVPPETVLEPTAPEPAPALEPQPEPEPAPESEPEREKALVANEGEAPTPPTTPVEPASRQEPAESPEPKPAATAPPLPEMPVPDAVATQPMPGQAPEAEPTTEAAPAEPAPAQSASAPSPPETPQPSPSQAAPMPQPAAPAPPMAEPPMTEPPVADSPIAQPPMVKPDSPEAASPPSAPAPTVDPAAVAVEPEPMLEAEPPLEAVPPEATPAPTAPSPEPEPALPAPALEWRSYRQRTCPECRPGEWAVVVAARLRGSAPCGEEVLDATERAASVIGSQGAVELAGYAGDMDQAVEVLDGEAAEIVSGSLAEARAGRCEVLGVTLPKGSRMVGFQYEHETAAGRRTCLPDQPCPGGGAAFIGPPRITRGAAATVIHARTSGDEGLALMTVFFRAPNDKWAPRP